MGSSGQGGRYRRSERRRARIVRTKGSVPVIVKFHARGAGSGSGPVDYLLGKDRDREGAETLRGDPEQTRELIDASSYAKTYTSGVLSFAEADLPDAHKRQIMDSFERALMPGLDADQYDCLWVEHRDKDRLELNFVIPNTELTTGRRLQPYYDRADRPRVDAWKTLTNAKYNLHDPSDPANQRALTYPANLPRDKEKAQRQVTDGLLALAEKGEVTNRAEVVAALEGAGFEVTRQTKTSISIADPEGGKPMRLRGKLYERDFEVGDSLRGEIERAGREYRESRGERLREARERLTVGVERKRAENQKRHPRPVAELRADRAQELDGGSHSRDRDVATERWGHLGVGVAHQEPGRHDHPAERHDKPFERTGRGYQSDDMRGQQEAVRRDRRPEPGREGVRREWPISNPEGVLDDQLGAGAIARLRAATERLRKAAKGVGERLRELANHVRGNQPEQPGLERAGEALKRAGDGLERSERQQDRTVERAGAALGSAGRGVEREREALDARGREAERVKFRQRGHDFGI